jgi:hypothetical protein
VYLIYMPGKQLTPGEEVYMYQYRRVKLDSPEAVLLAAQGWKIINVDGASGYALFEYKGGANHV